MDEDWRKIFRILMQPLGAGPGGVAPKVTGNSPMDKDWRNTFGILMCRELCDGAGAGICDGALSTCSSLKLFFFKYP